MLNNRNSKKYIKKTHKKKGGSRFIESKNACAIYFPLTLFEGKYQVVPNSVEKHHFEGFLDSLFNSEIFFKKTRNDLNKINKFMKTYNYMSYYKEGILKEINTPSINKKISELIKLKNFMDQRTSSKVYSMLPSINSQRKAISVMAGGSAYVAGAVLTLLGGFAFYMKDNLCKSKKVITKRQSTLASIISTHANIKQKPVPKTPKVSLNKYQKYKFDFNSSDHRRYVLGMIFESGERCILKLSKNPNYIPDYKMETKIYEHFRAHSRIMPVDVIDYYGTTPNGEKITVNNNILPIKVNINGREMKTRISINENGKYFYFAMEYNQYYNTLENALNNISSRIVRDRAIQNVCSSLGRLNSEYGFYHGDMKVDNVMINTKNHREVKNMDFDFSGILGSSGVQNTKMVYSYFDKKQSKVTSYIKSYYKSGKNSEAKDFLYFFDIYRLWCSLPSSWYGGRSGRYDTFHNTNKISAGNGNIQFQLGDFVNFFKTNGNQKFTYFNQKDITQRNIHILMTNIGKHLGLTEDEETDWNVTLMDEAIVFGLFEYICEKYELHGRNSSSLSANNSSSSRLSAANRVSRSSLRQSSSESDDDYMPAPTGLRGTLSRRKNKKTQKRSTVNSSQKSSKGPRVYVDNARNRQLGRVGKRY